MKKENDSKEMQNDPDIIPLGFNLYDSKKNQLDIKKQEDKERVGKCTKFTADFYRLESYLPHSFLKNTRREECISKAFQLLSNLK